jgi:hypothetical protein
MDQNELLTYLREGPVEIVFTKVNGDTRAMQCTLSDDYIPSSKKPKGTGTPWSNEAVRVFDIEKEDWRSFRYDSIVSVNL